MAVLSRRHICHKPLGWLPLVVGSGYFLSLACVGHRFVHKEFSIFKIIFWVSFQEVELLSQRDCTF